MTVIVDTCVWPRIPRRHRERHDPLICAIATRRGMRLLTTDTDFDQFAKPRPIILHAMLGRK